MNNYYEFINSVKILSGENALYNLRYELDFYKCKKPLVLSDEGLKKVGTLDEILKVLKLNLIRVNNVYTNIPTDSSTDVINNILSIYKSNGCDSILAIGGGSVIDTAKCVKLAISQNCTDITLLMGNENIKKGSTVPFIVVPTTSGTGSECTSVAVIKNSKTNIKTEIVSSELLPNVCVLDPISTLTLPPKLTVSTAIDALTHAIEAFSCMQKNVISDAFAISAMSLITTNLPIILSKPKNVEARINLANASCLAGIAFSNSMVGLVHAIGHALGSVCHIPHGIAMSILLPKCMDFNKEQNQVYYENCLLYLSAETCITTIPVKRCDACINFIKNFIAKTCEIAGITLKLSDYGVTSDHLNEIADVALADGAILVNNKRIHKENIISILSDLLNN